MRATLLVVVAFAVTACGDQDTAAPTHRSVQRPPLHEAAVGHAASGPATVLLERLPNGTTVLVDRSGQPLYRLAAETAGDVGTLTCTGACLTRWHPLLLRPGDLTPIAPPELGTTLGVVVRPGGALQVTYEGSPLYRWAGPGAAQRAGGWSVVTLSVPSGA